MKKEQNFAARHRLHLRLPGVFVVLRYIKRQKYVLVLNEYMELIGLIKLSDLLGDLIKKRSVWL